MALTAVVIKESVTQLNENDYQVSINIIITNEASDVLLDKNYSERYYSALDVDSVKVKLQAQIVVDWDRLVAEDDIYNKAAFGTMVSEIETAANNYINS